MPSNPNPLLGGAMQSRFAPTPSPFSVEERTSRGGMQRAAAFKALQDQMYGDPLADQRANIASHGTIETPQAFEARGARRAAADLGDPSTPMGRLRSQDMAHKFDVATGPARISADAQRDSARIAADNRLEMADLEGMYDEGAAGLEAEQSQQKTQADAMKQWMGILTGDTVMGRPELQHLQEMMRRQFPDAPFLEGELPEEAEEENLPWYAGITR